MARSLGAITVDLLLKIGGFSKGLEQAASESKRAVQGIQGTFRSLANAAASIGIGVGLAAIARNFEEAAKEAIRFGDEIDKLSTKTGVGSETLTELAYAAKQADIPLDALGVSFRKMQVAIAQAGAGGKEQLETFKALGIQFDAIEKMSADQAFELIAEQIHKLGSEADQNLAATRLFGKAGAELLPLFEQGAEGIRKAREEAERMGATLTDEQVKALAKADESVKRLGQSWDGLARTLTSAVGPALTKVFDILSNANQADVAAARLSQIDALLKSRGTIPDEFFADSAALKAEREKLQLVLDREQAEKRIREAQEAGLAQGPRSRRHEFAPPGFEPDPAKLKTGTDPAKAAREAIDKLIVSMQQQVAVTGQTEEATIKYRIAFGDLVDDFKKAGPAFEDRKQQLIDSAHALDQFKAGEELKKANEQIEQQVVDLAAAKIALEQGAAAAYVYQSQHGELAKTLDLATDSQQALTDAVQRGAEAAARLEHATAVRSIEDQIKAIQDETSQIIANKIAMEQGAVAALRYQIAHGNLKGVFEKAGAAGAELQKQLEAVTAEQEKLNQAQAELDASYAIIPDRTAALKTYDDALKGLQRRLAEHSISLAEYNAGVKIAEKNLKDATRAIDDLSVFAQRAAENLQDALADFIADPFKDGLDGMLKNFADTLVKMSAQIVAANLAEKFHFEDWFKGGGVLGGIFKTGKPGVLGDRGIINQAATATGTLDPGLGAAVPALVGAGTTVSTAITAAGTTTATALTTAATTSTTALTTAITTATAALTAAGTTVAAAITAAGTAAAASIAAAAAAGTGASGLEEIVVHATRLAGGGAVRGPGGLDKVPLWGTAGEFMVSKPAVDQPGALAFLEAFNARQIHVPRFQMGGLVVPVAAPHYADGGRVLPAMGTVSDKKSPFVVQQSITVNSPNGQVSRQTEMQITAAAARGARVADRHNN